MSYSQFTQVIAHMYLCTAFISDQKIGPILLAVVWIIFNWFVVFKGETA